MTYIVAEMSASHNGCLNTALSIVKAAQDCGADAIKLQTFEPEQLCVADYTIKKGPWKGIKLIELYKRAHTPKEWHKEIFDYASDIGIACFSTPFHVDDVAFLETLDCPRYKISSFEIVNTGLIAAAAQTGKPLIISTGMATDREIQRAWTCAYENGAEDITFLHCVSEYPAKAAHTNLARMNDIRDMLHTPVGLSDHSTGSQVPVMAATLGARIIEKHLCLEKTGIDGKFAMLPRAFKKMAKDVRAVYEIMHGDTETIYSDIRPSLYYARDMQAGETLSESDFVIARPNLGAHPSEIYYHIGKRLENDVKRYDPV